ncbi:MAG TPA: hypothetical protein VH643_12780 [Gemmataceae bacterium]|jgi:hypothetical protein
MITAERGVPSREARALILAGEAPEGLQVRGRLDLTNTGVLDLPRGLRCYHLELRGSGIRALPEGLEVEYKLDLQDCRSLEELPRGLKVGSLVLRGCAALRTLPEGLDIYFLDLQGCARLEGWPRRARVRIGRLNASGCTHLTSLPEGLRSLSQLDISNCPNLRELPEGLEISSWLDIGGSGVTRLPDSLAEVRLRWRGVPVDQRIAFRPETITVAEILGEPNAELRRVLLERYGFERFMGEAGAAVMDRDRDAGGERQLLRLKLEDDEDLVCVSVSCPSTARRYLLRVPPTMRTCHQAVAWTAGFDDPKMYRPLVET